METELRLPFLLPLMLRAFTLSLQDPLVQGQQPLLAQKLTQMLLQFMMVHKLILMALDLYIDLEMRSPPTSKALNSGYSIRERRYQQI